MHKTKRTSIFACPFCLAEEEDSFNSGASEFTHISEASTLNALLQATMLRIRATNRTIVGYVRCARFPQMQALASLFACGQPGYRGSHGDAVLRFFKIAINPHIDDIEKQVEQEVQLVSRLCANSYFDTICVHPIKSAYTLSKFAYSLLKMRTVKCTDKLKFMVAKQILDWGTQILLSTRLPEIQIFCTAPLVQSLFHHFHEMLIP